MSEGRPRVAAQSPPALVRIPRIVALDASDNFPEHEVYAVTKGSVPVPFCVGNPHPSLLIFLTLFLGGSPSGPRGPRAPRARGARGKKI